MATIFDAESNKIGQRFKYNNKYFYVFDIEIEPGIIETDAPQGSFAFSKDGVSQSIILVSDGEFWQLYPESGGESGLSLGETNITAYRGDRGKTAYDHSQVTEGNPHGTTAQDLNLEDAIVNGSEINIDLTSEDGGQFTLADQTLLGFNNAQIFAGGDGTVGIGDMQSNGNGTKMVVSDGDSKVDVTALEGLFVNGEQIISGIESLPSSQAEAVSPSDILYVNQLDLIVSNAGSPVVEGRYTYRGQNLGRNYWNLLGELSNPNINSLIWNGSNWQILSDDSYYEGTDTPSPEDAVWSQGAGVGALPVPSVTSELVVKRVLGSAFLFNENIAFAEKNSNFIVNLTDLGKTFSVLSADITVTIEVDLPKGFYFNIIHPYTIFIGASGDESFDGASSPGATTPLTASSPAKSVFIKYTSTQWMIDSPVNWNEL